MAAAAAAAAAGALLLASAGCCEFARGFLFPAPANVREPAFGELVEIHDERCDTVAMFVRAEEGMPTVVHFHGNGQQIADLAPFADALTKRGVGFFAPEFPGYGLAGGSTNEASLYRCGEASLAYLDRRLGVPASQVMLQGQSIGTGIAVEMASRGLGARMVLISAYTSMPALLESKGVSGSLACDRLDSVSKAPRVAIPVLLLHGTEDRVIPPRMSEDLAKRFPHATLWLLDGAHHNDVFYGEGGVEILDRIVKFASAR